MTEIKEINLTRMNNGAHFTYVSNIVARALADTTVASGKSAALVADLKMAVSQEDAALKISQKSLITDEINMADDDRDTFYMGYKTTVKGLLAMADSEKSKAAKVLWQHIKDYKIDVNEQMDKETGLLINFIDDLEQKYAAEVVILGLNAFVTSMKEANERVRSLTLERTNERMNIVVGALKNARKASDAAYKALVRMVNALALVNGETDYLSFIDYTNTEITHFKREVLGQKKSSSSSSSVSGSGSGSGSGSSSGSEGSTSDGGGSSSGSDGGGDSSSSGSDGDDGDDGAIE